MRIVSELSRRARMRAKVPDVVGAVPLSGAPLCHCAGVPGGIFCILGRGRSVQTAQSGQEVSQERGYCTYDWPQRQVLVVDAIRPTDPKHQQHQCEQQPPARHHRPLVCCSRVPVDQIYFPTPFIFSHSYIFSHSVYIFPHPYIFRILSRLIIHVPVYIFVCSFVFTCSFGRESDVRSEQALRSGSVALE
jgi:hypothetical protein